MNIIVCGIFHYKHIVDRLQKNNFLDGIYFSHKINSLNNIKNKNNIWIKEYCMQLWLRVSGGISSPGVVCRLQDIWCFFVKLKYKPSKIDLFLLHGGTAPLMRVAKKFGSIVVGEAVNVHPAKLIEILKMDELHHGVKYRISEELYLRKLEEIGMLDYLIAPSKAVADSYVEYGFPVNKICILPYGVPVDKIVKNIRCVESSDVFKILVVGQLSPRKGQIHLLKNLARFNKFKFSITVIGRGEAAYERAMKSVGVGYNYISHINHSDLLSLMSTYNVLVLNSLEDGFGMVVTEAMGVGLPVIVSKYAGASELVSKYGGGIVIDPLCELDICDAISRVRSGCFNKLDEPLPSWEDYADDLIKFLSNVEL